MSDQPIKEYTTTRNEEKPSVSKTDRYLISVVLRVEAEFPFQGGFFVLKGTTLFSSLGYADTSLLLILPVNS